MHIRLRLPNASRWPPMQRQCKAPSTLSKRGGLNLRNEHWLHEASTIPLIICISLVLRGIFLVRPLLFASFCRKNLYLLLPL